MSAGTADDGRPYFAMEHVPGVPITQHCDAQRLGVDERLQLFMMVCSAVQHAHQKAIIHRDLKPENILVAYEGGKAITKVIDFGVAKVLTERLTTRSLRTEFGQLIGTPAYMAPEQAEGSQQDIDTRADVYSLGVLLYKLLAGVLPFQFDSCSHDEMRRFIREVDPVRPSSRFARLLQDDEAAARAIAHARAMEPGELIRRLSSDLDWITMRCLEKERSRRYSGVDALAEDVRRHLAFEPISAGKPSTAYRMRKFIRRNRGAVASATLIGVILAGSVGFYAWNELRQIPLRQEHARLEGARLLEQGRMLLLSAEWEFRPDVDAAAIAVTDQRKSHDEARQLLVRSLDRDPSLVDADILIAYSTLLDGDRLEATAMARRIAAAHGHSPAARAFLAGLVDDPAEAERLTRGSDDAQPELPFYYLSLTREDPAQAIALLQVCLELHPWSFDALSQLAFRRGAARDFEGMLADATYLTRVKPDLALSWSLQGGALYALGRYAEAATAHGEAIRRDSSNWRVHYDRALALHGVSGSGDQELADLDRAIELAPTVGRIRALRAELRLTQDEFPLAISDYTDALRLGEDAWWVHQGRGEALRLAGDPERALPDFNAALERVDAEAPLKRARVLRSRGRALSELGSHDEAIADLTQACELEPTNGWAHATLGIACLRAGRYADALPAFDRALALDPRSDARYERAVAVWFAGDADAASSALTALAGLPDYHWMHLWVWDLESGRGNIAAADAALAAAEAGKPPKDVAFANVIDVLRGRRQAAEIAWDEVEPAYCLYAFYILGAQAQAQGRKQDAITWYERALSLKVVSEFENNIVKHHLRALTAGSG